MDVSAYVNELRSLSVRFPETRYVSLWIEAEDIPRLLKHIAFFEPPKQRQTLHWGDSTHIQGRTETPWTFVIGEKEARDKFLEIIKSIEVALAARFPDEFMTHRGESLMRKVQDSGMKFVTREGDDWKASCLPANPFEHLASCLEKKAGVSG